MNWILSLPLEVRLVIMFLLGLLIATQVNRGIYRLAWFSRDIGFWSRPAPHAPPRGPFDWIPIVGWWFLRRESPLHGRGFWIRPLLIELSMGIGFAALYWYEVDQAAVLKSDGPFMIPPPLVLHLQLLSHLILLSLMMVATFIDFDEQTIPDAITIPGTLLGLLISLAFPPSRTLVHVPSPAGYAIEYLHLSSGTARPGMPDWPPSLNGPLGLVLGLGCVIAWCVAIIPWTWTTRRGMLMAFRFWWASIPRRPSTIPIAVMGAVVSAVVAGVWLAGGSRWESLLSSLVGLAVGGGTIWLVRVAGSAALGQEAMGFGDVTLMAMIGAYTGWQPTPIIFFMAPFSAVIIAVIQYAVTRRNDIAFGPYLCLAATFWIVKSGALWWNYGRRIPELGWYFPAILISGLVLMGGMLRLWRLIREAFFPFEPDEDWQPAPQQTSVPAEKSSLGIDVSAAPVRSSCSQPHPLRKVIRLQPPASPIPGSRQLGQRQAGTQLFRP